MEQNSVDTQVSIGTQPADEVAVDRISFEELAQSEQESTDAVQSEQTKPQAAEPRDSSANPAENQEPESKAFARRLAEARAKDRQKFESDPAYQYGKLLLQQRAAKDNVSLDEAYRRVQADRVQQQAAEYAKNPQAYYEDVLRGNIQPQQAQVQQTQNAPDQIQSAANAIVQELIAADQKGIIPDGFDLNKAGSDFVGYAFEHGVEAALDRWQTSHASVDTVVSELQRRNAAPKPIRPIGTPAGAPRLDVSGMPKKDFLKLMADAKKAAMSGRRVTFDKN